MAEISQASTAINSQVEAAEKRLAATTVATSKTIEKAYAARTAAATAYAETTAAANAAVAASERAASAASVTSRALGSLRTAGAGLLGIMGGPLGLAVTAGAVALSFADFRSESERLKGDMTGLGQSIEAVRDEFNKLNRDQQQARVNEWRDKQLGAAMDVKASYGELKDSIRSAMIDTSNADFIDVGKVADQARAYDAVIEQLDAAKASGQALGPILREAAASGQVSPAQLKSWEQQAGLVSDNIDTLSGGAAATGASNVGFGLGQSLVSGGPGGAGASYAAGAGGATALGGALAGVGGALYGYGKSGLKGAATGAAGGVGGYYAGAAIGSLVGPIGTVIGGVIGSALGSLVGGSLFGGSWQTKDVGLSLGVTDGEFIGQQFEYQKKKGGLFGKNKKRTRYSALDAEMQEALDNTYDATIGGVESLFEQLNISLNDGVLDGLDISAVKISTKDKTTEEIQKELDAFFGDVAQKALNAISDATGSGISGVTVEQLTAFVNNLYAVNGAIKHLNIGLYETSIAGGKLAEQLAAAAGGLDVLTASAATYYDAFYTDTEKAGNILSDVREQFAKLNLALPETREGYRGLIESLDKSTESGRNAIAAYLNLSGAADQMYDILEASAAAAKAAFATALSDAVSGAMAGVQRAVAAQRDAISKAYTARTESLNDMLSTAQRSVTDLNGVSSTLEGALKSLRGTSDDAVKMLRSQAQATLEYALTVARKGGSISGIDGLSDAISTISSNNTDRYASLEEYLRDQGRATNLLGELEAINGKQLSNAEKTVKALESQLEATKKLYDSQISALDDQLALAQGQIDAINGVDNSVKSVADAVLTMSDSILAALSLQNPGAAAVNTYENNEAIVKAVYRSVLGRDAEAKGLADWAGALSGGLVTYQNLVESITREARANGEKTIRVPGFASGGDFGGGIRLVGERGPELELTGRSRIFNAQKTADMLMGSGGGAASEIRALREEMKAALFAIAKNTLKAAKNTDLLPRKLEEELFA
ncbi:DUF4214 domain-containing protein [Pseudomonas asiatica]|uniref:DUF4214 domain-containing protein n=1 Tax=Pseudomonas asiatica TaxID=2219225 RepID=UPI002E7B9087|nr:DUF4214 domain-containing protein [Pseudomonas asiatica]MEE1914994.1 DUF4214 domain-containing protein [Pseudomonas asiatica]